MLGLWICRIPHHMQDWPAPHPACQSPSTKKNMFQSHNPWDALGGPGRIHPKGVFMVAVLGATRPAGTESHAFLQQICFWKTSGYHVKAKVSKSRSSLKCKMMPVGRRGPVIWYSKTMWRARRDAVTPTPQPPARPTAM